MRDFGEYLLAYRSYVSANLGWPRALLRAIIWFPGMLAPLWAKTFVHIPGWLSISWMIGWASLSYIFAPYGMWKHYRTFTQNSDVRKSD